MPSLDFVQARLRDAIVGDAAQGVVPLLVGGRDAARRLAVHRRHYEASLIRALLDKFPAVTWLTGTTFMTEAARWFVHRQPPLVPCIAEYGAGFPRFLADCAGAERMPYLCSFAELEWHLGHVAIAVDHMPLTMAAFAVVVAGALPDVELTLQPGLHYCAAEWPLDDLIKLYLNDAKPDHYVFEPTAVHLEIRGARGEFRIGRLDAATFAFRQALAQGRTIGVAAERASEKDIHFDPGRALVMLVSEGLVIAMGRTDQGEDA